MTMYITKYIILLSSIFNLGFAWSPQSWRTIRKSSKQIPEYYKTQSYTYTTEYLKTASPLVFAEEIRTLKRHLSLATIGKTFVYIGGDCAETFKDSNTDKIWKDFRLLLEVSLLLTIGLEKPIVKIARIAGQYAKPRSDGMENRNGLTLPAYQGDIINGMNFSQIDRTPNPLRMITAYHKSCQTLNILRAFIQGGYSNLWKSDDWRLDSIIFSPMNATYKYMYSMIRKTLAFIKSIGLDSHPKTQSIELFTGHEALLLPYEEPLTRKDSITNDYYACSAHFLWIGERTRELDGQHVEFFRGIKNPIGVKISQDISPEQLLNLTHILNPENEPGRLTIMTRMGSKMLEKHLPELIKILQQNNRSVVWICDPMHANTVVRQQQKTRYLTDIWEEIRIFCEIHWSLNSSIGGIHLESTGQNVTEVMGGTFEPVTDLILDQYKTVMDPRLNYIQTIELCLMLIMHFSLNSKHL